MTFHLRRQSELVPGLPSVVAVAAPAAPWRLPYSPPRAVGYRQTSHSREAFGKLPPQSKTALLSNDAWASSFHHEVAPVLALVLHTHSRHRAELLGKIPGIEQGLGTF